MAAPPLREANAICVSERDRRNKPQPREKSCAAIACAIRLTGNGRDDGRRLDHHQFGRPSGP